MAVAILPGRQYVYLARGYRTGKDGKNRWYFGNVSLEQTSRPIATLIIRIRFKADLCEISFLSGLFYTRLLCSLGA